MTIQGVRIMVLLFASVGLIAIGWALHERYAARLKAWWDEVL